MSLSQYFGEDSQCVNTLYTHRHTARNKIISFPLKLVVKIVIRMSLEIFTLHVMNDYKRSFTF